jgi:hypothetical protein
MSDIPGFTAEAALYKGTRNYRTMAVVPAVSGVLMPATARDGKLEWIDCDDFPNNQVCRECGNTGPGSAVCCPDDYCVVIDKTPSKSVTVLTRRRRLRFVVEFPPPTFT